MAILSHAPHPNAAQLFKDFYHGEVAQNVILEKASEVLARKGLKSSDPVYPKPIYELKGFVPMDWRKVGSKERYRAREEFRRLVIRK